MKFAIMFEASPLWAGTDEVDMLENLMPFWMETYFKSGNYLLIDNKPVVSIYDLTNFISGLGGVENAKAEMITASDKYVMAIIAMPTDIFLIGDSSLLCNNLFFIIKASEMT